MQHKFSIHYSLIFLFLVFIFPSITQAASGCCKVMKETGAFEISASEVVYLTMESEDCEKQKGPNSEVTFEEGKQASEDKNSCEDVSGTTGETKPSKPIPPQLQVSIPGFGKFSDVTCDDPETPCAFPWIGEYIGAIYDYGIGIVGILSVIVMMIGGVIRLTAGGNHSQISQGNTYIKSSILGVVFTLCSYMILFIVNPNLTILKPINVSYITNIPLEEIKDTDHNHGLEPEPLNIDNGVLIGSSGAVCKESERVRVPNDVNGLGILDQSGQSACPDAINALKKAAQCMKNKNEKYIIRVSSASRTLQRQKELYAEDASNACNPYRGNCPSTTLIERTTNQLPVHHSPELAEGRRWKLRA
jgi:hypothetical protein